MKPTPERFNIARERDSGKPGDITGIVGDLTHLMYLCAELREAVGDDQDPEVLGLKAEIAMTQGKLLGSLIVAIKGNG